MRAKMSLFSLRKLRTFSRPWPMRSPWKLYQAPLLSTMLWSDGEVERVALAGDAFAVEDVELGVAEGSGDLVLDDLDLGAGADDDVAFLDGADAADVDAHGGVELERACRRWWFRGCRT